MGKQTNRWLVFLTAVLVVGLVVVIYLWQQQEESTDVEFNIDVPEESSMDRPEQLPQELTFLPAPPVNGGAR